MAQKVILTPLQREHAIDLHKKVIVLDGHSDIGIDIARRRYFDGEQKVNERVHLPQLQQGGVKASMMTIMSDSGSCGLGTSEHPTTLAFRTLQAVHQDMAESADFMTFATSVRGIREAVQAQRIPFVLHFEGAKPFGENTELVNAFQTCGVRSAQLTWNGRNLVADGAGERSGAGLSNFGVDLVREMNRQHMLIDLSHISDRGFWDALEFSQDPMIVSHANCRSLCDHPRNLTDDQIKALAGKGGVIGVCFYSGFISKNEATLDKLLDHLDHIVDLVGVEHVGVGPDFVYYDHAYLTVKYPKGLEDTTKMLNLTEGLMTRGYSDEEITKIWGENLLGVYQRVWGS